MEDCVFCKIVREEIPSNKVLETDLAYAFMDISPLSLGHTLFIPKDHAVKMHEMADETLSDILVMIKKVVKAAGFDNYNVLQNNGILAHQEVMHAHWHLIPKLSADIGLKLKWETIDSLDQSKIADKIRSNLIFEFD